LDSDDQTVYLDLVRNIKERLQAFRDRIENTLFIAPAAPELRADADRLCRDFEIASHDVLRMPGASGMDESSFEKESRRRLRWSGRSIHLLNERMDEHADDWTRSDQVICLREAGERFGNSRNRVFQYSKPGCRLPTTSLAGFTSLDNLSGSPFEQFDSHLSDVLSSRPKSDREALVDLPGEKYIYFHCDAADSKIATALEEKYSKHRIKLVECSTDGNFRENWTADRNILQQCRAAILYYGRHKTVAVNRYGGKIAAEFKRRKALVLDPGSRPLRRLPSFDTLPADGLDDFFSKV